MIKANTIDADKYFHCKANYEAAKVGYVGRIKGRVYNNMREIYGLVKGDGFEDMKQDMKANMYGQDAAQSGQYETAEQACAIYRPRGLNEKH